MSRKIVINVCYGGYILSANSKTIYDKRTPHQQRRPDWRIETDVSRDDPTLLQLIDSIGLKAAAGDFCELQIVVIPDDVKWEIHENDGSEWVAEKHSTWHYPPEPQEL